MRDAALTVGSVVVGAAGTGWSGGLKCYTQRNVHAVRVLVAIEV